MKNTLFTILSTCALLLMTASAAYAKAATAYTGNPIADELLSTLVYSAIGVIMAVIAYKVIDMITPGHLGQNIAEDSVALATLAGLTILGICIIIAAVIAS